MNLVSAALRAVDPGAAVRSHFRLVDSLLDVDGHVYDLNAYQRIIVVGGGKGSAPMAQAVEAVLGERITSGIISVKYG